MKGYKGVVRFLDGLRGPGKSVYQKEKLWLRFVKACEPFAAELDDRVLCGKWTRQQKNKMSALAETTISPMVDQKLPPEHRPLDIHWLHPQRILPWAARFATETPYDVFSMRLSEQYSPEIFSAECPRFLRPKKREGAHSLHPDVFSVQLLKEFCRAASSLHRLERVCIRLPFQATTADLVRFRDAFRKKNALTRLGADVGSPTQWAPLTGAPWPHITDLTITIDSAEEAAERSLGSLEPGAFPNVDTISINYHDVYGSFRKSRYSRFLRSFPKLKEHDFIKA